MLLYTVVTWCLARGHGVLDAYVVCSTAAAAAAIASRNIQTGGGRSGSALQRPLIISHRRAPLFCVWSRFPHHEHCINAVPRKRVTVAKKGSQLHYIFLNISPHTAVRPSHLE